MTENITVQPCRIEYFAVENIVRVELENFDTGLVLKTLEAISIAIANADPDGNPYGLFWHPETDAETTLVFGYDAMLYQDAVALLVEEMYVSCNNPAHICIETDGTVKLMPKLAEQVACHLRPRAEGGYVAEYRPKATWTWRCHMSEGYSADAIETYKEAGGDIVLFQPPD